MTKPTLHSGPVGDLIRAQELSWRKDHDEVKECWQFEDRLAVVLWLFELVRDAHRTWRDGVLTGRRPWSGDHEEALKTHYQGWLRLSDHYLQPLAQFEAQFGQVEGSRDLHRCRWEAREIMETWQSPVPPLPAHTQQPLTAAQLADRLTRTSRPVAQANVPLDNPPDPDTLS